MRVKENAEPPVAPEDSVPSADAVPADDGEVAAALNDEELRASLEALLYAAEEPLTVKDLAKALPEVPRDAIKTSVEELVTTYDAPGRGLQVARVAGGYQITTRPEYHERISRLFSSKPPSRLSLQALETLAAIAYRQPITVPEIMELRGLHSAGVVRTLLEKKLIRITGRKKVVGRPLLYGTTKEFLIRFGLKGLDELPNLEDMAEVFGEEIASQLGDVMKETPDDAGPAETEIASSDDSPQRQASHEPDPDGSPDAAPPIPHDDFTEDA